ncbi:MAG TPA: alkaline phosphatase D family protein [Fodinibius sp.]|nr:alkaline phosphatase D family protein [Fodinibius sp.]
MSNDEKNKDENHQSDLSLKKWLKKKIDRKDFLHKSTKITKAVVGSALMGGPLMAIACSDDSAGTKPPPSEPEKKKDPFQLGVASGDPLPDGVVLWTRLAPEPLKINGGMSSDPAEVKWEVAEDKSFQQIVKRGTVTATADYAHSVHVELEGLKPFHKYYYRFKHKSHVSDIGRTKTAPSADADIDQLNFAFASCQSYTNGYYTAHDHLAKEDIDVLFFLGDYMYQSGEKGSIGRPHIPSHTTKSLTDYRTRYAQYKSDPSLKAAHAAFPWIVTFDDHEVKNNWASDFPSANAESGGTFLDRRARAFQAYYEHMPLRKSSIPDNFANMQIYRRFSYGNLADFNVLDTRQFRTDYACNTGGYANCPERMDPSRTMLGDQQEQWLFSGLEQSSARWNILPQQVFMGQMDRKSGPNETFSMDRWDGYTGTRDRLFNAVKKHDVSNFVVLTGDIHRNFAADLLEDFNDPNSAAIGSELVATSISSAGNGADITSSGRMILDENPWIKFVNRQRGYVRCQLTPDQLKADYRIVNYVEKPGAPIHTRASFVIKDGQPGVTQISGREV